MTGKRVSFQTELVSGSSYRATGEMLKQDAETRC